LSIEADSHEEYVLAVARRLIQFIYRQIELARRRSLAEMVDAARTARNGDDLRRRILDYLERSEWDDALDKVRDSRQGGMEYLGTIVDEVVSPNDAAALR